MTIEEVYETYQPTIGIECHVQLRTRTKLFSGADNDARGKAPNTTVSPICFGFPGVLPVLNQEAVTLAIRAGLAMKADIAPLSRFERKHYFYPDLPKGYQITQLAEPIILGGTVETSLPDGTPLSVRIHHAHMEEDAGKLTHPTGADYSLVDLNRAGTPLIEVVSEPDIHSPAEAKAFAQELYRLMTFAGVTDGDLYHGNMRFDVNVSLALVDATELGTRTETKNLNSFRSVEKAAEYEILRQAALLDRGETIDQETRGWNEAKQKTISQRSKENAHDYRYFPDADIPPLYVTDDQVQAVREHLPLLPQQYRDAWSSLGIDDTVVNALLASPKSSAPLVYELQEKHGDAVAKKVAHWLSSVVEDADDDSSVSDDTRHGQPVPLEYFVELANMTTASEVKSSDARIIFNEMLRSGNPPRTIAEEKNLIQSNDMGEIEAIVDMVLAEDASQKAVTDIRAGNVKAAGYLVGQAMKRSQGKANPALLQQIIIKKLEQ